MGDPLTADRGRYPSRTSAAKRLTLVPSGSQGDMMPTASEPSHFSETNGPEVSQRSDRASEAGSIMSAPDMYHPEGSGRLEEFTSQASAGSLPASLERSCPRRLMAGSLSLYDS